MTCCYILRINLTKQEALILVIISFIASAAIIKNITRLKKQN